MRLARRLREGPHSHEAPTISNVITDHDYVVILRILRIITREIGKLSK